MFFLFKTKPKIPIRNKNIEKFILNFITNDLSILSIYNYLIIFKNINKEKKYYDSIWSLNHNKKSFMETDCIDIGIELWSIPHISEHWPKNVPLRFKYTEAWFNLPG